MPFTLKNFQALFIFIHIKFCWKLQRSMLSSKYWCYLQTCGNLWYFSWHRRIHWVYDWVYNHRASLLHVWCRSAYYSWQVSLLKVLDAVRYIVIYCLLRLICYSNIPTLSDWAQQQCKFPQICSNIFKNLVEKPHTNLSA